MKRPHLLAAAAAAAAVLLPGTATAATGPDAWAQAGCGGCHTLGAAGSTGTAGPNLDYLRPSSSAVASQVTYGGGGMPSFAGSLSSAQIQALAAWVASVAGGTSTSGATASPAGNAPPGMTTSAVRRLQSALARLGFFHHAVTGFYGPVTTAAVKKFQRAVGLKPDGVWGPRSEAALKHRLG